MFIKTFNQGGYLMWCILGTSLVIWYIGVNKFFYLKQLGLARQAFLKQLPAALEKKEQGKKTGFIAFDKLLSNLFNSNNLQKQRGYDLFREFLIESVPVLEKGFSTMSVWVAAAPLLGLLGTVVGMIQTFKVIMLFGIGNPNLMAEGISIALLTTQAGLTVAFPGMMLHNFLLNRKNVLVNELTKDGEDLINLINKKEQEQ